MLRADDLEAVENMHSDNHNESQNMMDSRT